MLTPPAATASNNTPAKRLFADPGSQLGDGRGQTRLGHPDGFAQRSDFLGGLDPPGGAHGQLTVDQLGVGERGRQQLRENR